LVSASRAGYTPKVVVVSGVCFAPAEAFTKKLWLSVRLSAETGRITATYGCVIGYLGRGYSIKGIAFRMGVSEAIVKARVGVAIAWLGLTKRIGTAHDAPHFVMI